MAKNPKVPPVDTVRVNAVAGIIATVLFLLPAAAAVGLDAYPRTTVLEIGGATW